MSDRHRDSLGMFDRQSPFLGQSAAPGAGLQRSGAVARLREAIVSCELPPGLRVSEADLAARFGFGKAAVRAALAHLEAAGLVKAQPRSGWAVTPLNGPELAAVVDARRVAESGFARLGPMSDAIAILAASAAAADATAVAGDRASALRTERQWRDQLASLLDNAIVRRWLAEAWDRSERIGVALDLPLALMAPGGRVALTAAFATAGGTALVASFAPITDAFATEASRRLLRHAQLLPSGAGAARRQALATARSAPAATMQNQKPSRQGGTDR